MSLVGYDYSDDDDDPQDPLIDNETKQNDNHLPTENSVNIDSDKTVTGSNDNSSKLLANLPPIQNVAAQSLDKNAVKRTSDGRIQIAAPSLHLLNSAVSDDDSEEEERQQRERLQKSNKGSRLISMLPKPKNRNTIIMGSCPATSSASISKSSLTSLVPNSVANRNKSKLNLEKPTTSKAVNANTNNDKQKDEIGQTNFFFSNEDDNDSDDENVYLDSEQISSPNFSSSPIIQTDAPVYGPAKPAEPLPTKAKSTIEPVTLDPNDDVTYKKFIASKFGDQPSADIKIVDFDMSKHLSENKEWLKNITLENEEDPEIEAHAPNSTARRKNQITFLAYQARKREIELKNQWAQNKIAKTQTKAKYGF
ncbi:hypothetical protein RDWZM_008755 [Blomia tropicalis]|uniref:Proline-rich protein PRCC n=1 Tax=Blomia tropicalis TaxID=40697 RepID=A0A9Q0RJ49_BLOTA|nr:hypothetical protein RDWZM_008755 [Blomia tropicalis]